MENNTMNARMALHQRARLAATALAALCLGAVVSQPANAAVTTVYKCFDRNLGVLFTDEPCGGERMQIQAGQADPAAVEALARERDAVSRSAEQRIIDNRRASLQQDMGPQWAYPPQNMEPTGYAPAYLPYGGYDYGSNGPGRRYGDGEARGDHRGEHRGSHRTVPAPPGRLIIRR
jgi:hypothetical protein